MRNCSGRASSASFTTSSGMLSSTSVSGVRLASAASRPPRRRKRKKVLGAVVEIDLSRAGTLRSVGVDERVGRDLVEPRLQVGARAGTRRPFGRRGRYVSCTRSSASAGLRVMRRAAEYNADMYGVAARANFA